MKFENRYGLLDRWLHKIAFATGLPQCGVADLEERWCKKKLAARELGVPLLVTALPRAGTTIFLELLLRTGDFASHTYRDMPFVLCPLFWNRFSKPFRRKDAPRERMHGDGIQVSLDSPEALEETIWKRFWRKNYKGSAIEVWQDCKHPEFAEFFSAHMRKIVALRARQQPTVHRYVSKNNLNIARIPALWDAIPDAKVIVLFREPRQHAASLLRQHKRFSDLQKSDPFVRSYMAGVGHFDFGLDLKPVNFGGWLDGRADRDANEPGFWLDYWLAAYEHVLRHVEQGRLHFLSYERLVSSEDLAPLAECLGIDPGQLAPHRAILKAPKPHDVAGLWPAARQEDATALYMALTERSVL